MSGQAIIKAPEDTNNPQSQTKQITRTPDEFGGQSKEYLDVHLLNRQDKPLYFTEVEGPGIIDPLYDGSHAAASGQPQSTIEHTFAPTGAFRVRSVSCSSALDASFKVQLKRGANPFATSEAQLAVPAHPNVVFDMGNIVIGPDDGIKVVKANRNITKGTDLHSTIKGEYVVL